MGVSVDVVSSTSVKAIADHRFPDVAAVVDLVHEVVDEVLARDEVVIAGTKRDGSVVTDADLRIQRALEERLQAQWPGFLMLGEEMSHAEHRDILKHSGDGYWCLDPIDGTTNFATGLPFFSISLALVIGDRPVLGVVYDPVRRESFTAVAGSGAALNGAPLQAQDAMPLKCCVAAVDFKRLEAPLATRLAVQPPYRSQRNIGSAALEWCWLAAGRFQLSVHGSQNLWDCAAGSLVLSEMGGAASTFDGGDLLASPLGRRSVVAASNADLYRQWYDWLHA